MKRNLLTAALISLFSIILLTPVYADAGWRQDNRQERRIDDQRDDRQSDRRFDRRDDRRDHRRYETRRGNRLTVITPRHRRFRNIIIVRPHGHAYHGYGHFRHDNDAWKWLSFTAITLKLLDMVDEQAQREHEAAQMKATTAVVGEKIVWETEAASGYVVTTKEGINNNGLTCREYQQTITVGGKNEEAYGTACLQADGSWKIAS